MRSSAEGAVFMLGIALMVGEIVHRTITRSQPSPWAMGFATVLVLGGLFAWRFPDLARKADRD